MVQAPIRPPSSVRSLVAAIESQNTTDRVRSTPPSHSHIPRSKNRTYSSSPRPTRSILKQDSAASLSPLFTTSETSRTRFSDIIHVVTVPMFQDYAEHFYGDEEIADFKYNKILLEAGVLEEW